MISIVVPTRKRPKEFKRMCDSIVTTQLNKTEIVAYIDDDDTTIKDYPAEDDYANLSIIYIVGPRIILTQCWNECLPHSTGDIFLQGNDDIIFKTIGWDAMVEAEFAACPDKILLVHGSDEGQHFNRFAAHGFVHKRWIEAIGYFIPPYFSSDYGDNWLNDLANACGRRKYIPIVIEHMHFLFKKAPLDETYQDRLARHRRDNPGALYYSTQMINKRVADINKLKRLIGQMEFSLPQQRTGNSGDAYAQHIFPKCPRCKSSSTNMSQGRYRCNQCGFQW